MSTLAGGLYAFECCSMSSDRGVASLVLLLSFKKISLFFGAGTLYDV